VSNLTELNKLTKQIIGAAIEVHRHLGPGLLESTYETCLAYELQQLGLSFERQKALPLVYKEIRLDQGDLLVERKVVVEIKVVEQIAPVHEAQVLSYLKFSGCQPDVVYPALACCSISTSSCSRMTFAAL